MISSESLFNNFEQTVGKMIWLYNNNAAKNNDRAFGSKPYFPRKNINGESILSTINYVKNTTMFEYVLS